MPRLNMLAGNREPQTFKDPGTDPEKMLAAAMLIAAYKDLKSTRPYIEARAMAYFDAGGFHIWADILHVDYDVVLQGRETVLRSDYHELFGREQRRMVRK